INVPIIKTPFSVAWSGKFAGPTAKKIKININNITGLQFLSIFFNISKRKGQNKLNKYCCGLSLPK
ncbi:hypothetical protein, partial [Proteus mirabilis]|uniref:hypothetical protein n=1 Tax=Proteus mirabilis TaxID=584 RepID=UPI00142F4AB0